MYKTTPSHLTQICIIDRNKPNMAMPVHKGVEEMFSISIVVQYYSGVQTHPFCLITISWAELNKKSYILISHLRVSYSRRRVEWTL